MAITFEAGATSLKGVHDPLSLLAITVEATPEGGRVTISTALTEGHAEIVVRDTGPGLPEGGAGFRIRIPLRRKSGLQTSRHI
ncbi:MAG: ATP-binding protein [Thermodesulfovibrionales bacterium]|nr:ATP-binding protein [Thermodesulfovibrionales bacterium]